MTPERLFLDEIEAAFRRYRDRVPTEAGQQPLPRIRATGDAVASLVGRISALEWEVRHTD